MLSITTLNKGGFNLKMWLKATAALVLKLSKKVVVCYSIGTVLISYDWGDYYIDMSLFNVSTFANFFPALVDYAQIFSNVLHA